MFMFSTTAFSFDLRDAIKSVINNVNKVTINDTEVPFIKHKGKVYVPMDTFTLAGANISQELSTLKVNNLYDAETAYKELTEMYDRHLERIKNPIPSKAKDAVNLHQERYYLVCSEIIKLDTIDIKYGDSKLDGNLFSGKADLGTVLYNEMLVHAGVYEATANNNKLAKRDIEELESSLVLYGNYAERTFKAMEDAYNELKEAK